jgi:hypothetical protein
VKAQVCRLTNKERTKITDPIDAFEHANAEIQAPNIHRICSLSLSGSHLRVGLGLARRTGSSGRRPINRRVNIISDEFILYRSVREAQWLKELVRKTDNDFVVVICITELMHDFDYDADEIALARRQRSQ